jgi:16S rRNA (adenine1518-N6/adenine1519-N6)-dimethyltransferase
LVDAAVNRRLIDCIAPASGAAILEIGPGLGALTRPLVEAGADVMALELDRILVERLRADAKSPRLIVVEGDALARNWTQMTREVWGDRPVTVIGNLPYYITGPLVARLWEESALGWTRAVFMCQAEVGARLAAIPGSPLAGAPTVLLQTVGTVRRLFDVDPAAFDPPPQVTSTVIEVARRPAPAIDPLSALQAVVRAGFGQRRKMLPRALAALGPAPDWWKARLRDRGIDPGRRAERLTLEEWSVVTALWAQDRAGPWE